MPTHGDSASVSGTERLQKQNLAKIEKIRSSGNPRLVSLVDDMEETMTAKHGEEGYLDFLSRAPLETLIKRYQASAKGRRPSGQGNGAKGATTTKAAGDSVTVAPSEEEEQHYDYRYSTDVEQQLLDDRRSASAPERRTIDAELDAIHASRLSHLAHDMVFDEITAEQVLENYRSNHPDNDGGGPTVATIPPARPAPARGAGGYQGNEDDGVDASGFAPALATGEPSGAPHENDFNPNALRAEGAALEEGTTSGGSGLSDKSPVGSSHSTPTISGSGSNAVSGAPVAPPTGDVGNLPKLDNGLHAEATSEVVERGGLVEDEEDDRGRFNKSPSLDDGTDAIRDAAEQEAEAQKEQKDKQDRKRRKLIISIVMNLMTTLGPVFLVIMALLMLAQCVDQLNPFRGLGGSAEEVMSTNGAAVGTAASGTTPATRRSNGTASSIPTVQVDPELNAMFAESSEEEGEEEDEEEQDDGELTDKQKRVIEACKTTPSAGAGWCAAWVGEVFANANVGVTFSGDARDWWHAFCNPDEAPASCEAGTVKTDPKRAKLKPGMVIAVPSSSSGSDLGAIYGHVGIYIGDNKVMHNIGPIATCTVDEWIATYGQYADVGWGWADGIKLGGSGKKGSKEVGDALNLHISSQKEIKTWAKKIDKYLAGHGAVSLGFKGQYFAEAAAKYGIDPRLSAAQSCIEQARGDIVNPWDTYNLWGWGVYGEHKGMIQTSNARDACFKHAKGLSEGYGSSFGPEQVETYCPGNTEYWPWLKREAETITNL